jgi:hypothetical protein
VRKCNVSLSAAKQAEAWQRVEALTWLTSLASASEIEIGARWRDEGGASWREHDVRKYHQAAVRINIDSYMDKRLRFGAESMPDAGHNMQHAPPTTPAAVTYQLTTAID